MKKLLVTPLLLLMLGACTLGDDTAPSPPEDFLYDPSSRTFTWVASGDDGQGGGNFFNDIRYLDGAVSNAAFNGSAFFHHQVGEGFPRLPGTGEFFVARRPDPAAYFTAALQVRDEVSNASAAVPADLDPGPATDNSPVATNLAQLTLRTGTSGALDASGDLNGDRLSDLVVVDADAGSERMYIYLGRSAFPFFAADLETGAEPDPAGNAPGDCTAGPGRFCAPDIVVDLSGLDPLNTGSVGGLSAFAAGQGLPPRTLSVGDITGDGLAEIVVGAPEFTPAGESQERGAAFVFSFHETLVSVKAGEESLFFLYNPADRPASPAPIRTYLGKTVDAGLEGLVVEDVLCEHCTGPADDGIEIDAPASEKQEWRLYDSEPIQVLPSPTCPGLVPRCTGADLRVAQHSPSFDSESIDFEGLEGEFLLVVYDPGTGDPDFAAVVKRFDPSRLLPTDPVDSGFFGRIVVDRRRATKPLSDLTTAADQPFALFRKVAEGERLETDLSSGTVGDPLLIGNLRKRYDLADDAGTARTIIDPTDLADVPGPGEERPFATFLGPEVDARFGEVVSTEGDTNLDGTADLAVSAPGLDTLPSRYGTFAVHADRGGVIVIYGDDDLAALDVPFPGGFPDGLYDFGATGEDRPQAIILGRDAGDYTGSSLAAMRVRGDRPETDGRGEHALVVAALAIGAPGANPSPAYYDSGLGVAPAMFGCGIDLNGNSDGDGTPDADENERDNAGAVYFFVPHREFEARDYWPLGGLPDGIYDLDDDTPLCDVASAEIWGEVAGDELGTSVLLDLDANGDHILDLAVGAPGWGSPDVGKIYVFLGTTRETTPSSFNDFDKEIVGAISAGGFFSFFNRGNVDANRRVDDDENESLIGREDRCVLCLYDLSESFLALPSGLEAYAAGPDLIVEGGVDARIGLDLSAGFLDPDGFEDVLLLAQGTVGDWPLFLSGATSLLLEYRQIGVVLPHERPHPGNYEDTGTAGTFVNAPGNAATAGGIVWWVERDTVISRVGKLGQGKVEVQAIYGATSTGGDTEDARAFGRSLTDDAVDLETQSTVQIEFINRDVPDRVFRWNAVTTGGLFPVSGASDAPFASSLDVFSFGGDVTGDNQEDLLLCVGSGEIRGIY